MSQYEDLLIDALLDVGFTLDEASRLIVLQQRPDIRRRRYVVKRPCQLWLGDDCEHIWN